MALPLGPEEPSFRVNSEMKKGIETIRCAAESALHQSGRSRLRIDVFDRINKNRHQRNKHSCGVWGALYLQRRVKGVSFTSYVANPTKLQGTKSIETIRLRMGRDFAAYAQAENEKLMNNATTSSVALNPDGDDF